MIHLKKCLACGKELEGRIDKKFCDAHCKSAYQYEQTKIEEPKFYSKVNNQLKLNRRVLKHFNKAGKSIVRASTLIEQGFDSNFFTHYWKNNKGDIYLFVYEYGFLKRRESGKDKYVLILWQEYME
jgi:hypothetical protein